MRRPYEERPIHDRSLWRKPLGADRWRAYRQTMARLRRSDPTGPGYHRTGKRLVDEAGKAVPAEVKQRVEALVVPPAWTVA